MISVLPARATGRVLTVGQARPACAVPTLRRSVRSARPAQCSASAKSDQQQEHLVKAASLTSAVGAFLDAGNVSAAQELANAAARSDSRSLLGLALGLATLATAQQASASAEVAELAASDNRLGIIFVVLLPVVGWVLYNIFGPAKNQLDNMTGTAAGTRGRRRSIAGALGLGAASLLAAQHAQAIEGGDVLNGAAQAAAQVSQAVSVSRDGRFGIISVVFLPVIGWVLFNIYGPAVNQLNNMSGAVDKPQGRRRGVAGAVGLSAASLLAAQQADAASEVAQLAAGDNRFAIIAVVLLPVVGWVLFNIYGPALNQLKNMTGSVNKPQGRRR